jgi:Uma2 family endonuclease
MTELARSRAPRPREVVYPTSDGKPMAETDKHRKLMMYAIEALEAYFADRSDVYVSGNNFVFYEEGNPRACLSPDTYVVFGVSPELRDCYMSWKEGGRLPDVVFEFTSKKTKKEDTETKRPRYERVLRVKEYFLFDPTGDYLRPRFQGYRLEGDRYVRLEVVDGRLHSEQLGLDLVQQGEDLRFFDPKKGEWLLSPAEQAAELVRLREEVARLRRRVGDGLPPE